MYLKLNRRNKKLYILNSQPSFYLIVLLLITVGELKLTICFFVVLFCYLYLFLFCVIYCFFVAIKVYRSTRFQFSMTLFLFCFVLFLLFIIVSSSILVACFLLLLIFFSLTEPSTYLQYSMYSRNKPIATYNNNKQNFRLILWRVFYTYSRGLFVSKINNFLFFKEINVKQNL